MNCTVCGRGKQRQNLLEGVCRSCRRAGEVRVSPSATNALVRDALMDYEPSVEYEPGENARVEGGDVPPTLEEFSRLHHKTQERVMRELGCPWVSGTDRDEAYRAWRD